MCHWMRVLNAAGVIVTGGCLVFGCSPAPAPKPPASAGVVRVMPVSAGPGDVVRIETDRAVFNGAEAPVVRVGAQAAKVQRVLSDREALVIMPPLTAGPSEIRLQESGRAPGSAASLEVLPPEVQRLVLTLEGDQIKLLATQPGGGLVQGARATGRRLSYDVLNEQGGLVFTGDISHPAAARTEIFDEPQPGKRIIRGGKPSQTATFVLKVPALPGMTVRFYDAASGLNLGTEQGRAARVYLSQITLGK